MKDISEATPQPELRTERLVLRRFRAGDVDDVLTYSRDEEWSRYLRREVPFPYSRQDAEANVMRRMLAGGDLNFAIDYGGTVIGSISLRVEHEELTAEIGYGIGREHWGKGFMPEAVRTVIAYGFRAMQLAKIFAPVDVRNTRSQRVLETCGFVREGVLRAHEIGRDGQRVDYAYYGLLQGEWGETGSSEGER